MKKIYLLQQESNVDGEIYFHTVPCMTLELARQAMANAIETLQSESIKYGGCDFAAIERGENNDFAIERSDNSFYISCTYDDYYEEFNIVETELIGDEKAVKTELYDEICKVLTWYERPDERNLSEEDVSENLYNVLVKVQNSMF